MDNQRIGGQGEHFVKQEKGDQVSSQGNSNGYGYTETEIAEKMAAIGGTFKVAHSIDCSQQPEHTGQGGKEGRQWISI